MTTEPDQARTRYFILTAMRAMATAMVAGGAIIAFGERGWLPAPYDQMVGIALIVLGFIDLAVVVPMLTRRWRSPN